VRRTTRIFAVATAAAVTALTAVVVLASAGPDHAISLALKGRYTGGGAEIAAYDRQSKRLFVTDADNKRVDVVSIADPAAPSLVGSIAVGPGTPTSVDADHGVVAVSVSAALKTDPGTVRFFDADGASLHPGVAVGALPDMLTFTPDHRHLLVANEGEPSGYGTPPPTVTYADPEGSVSVIDVRRGVKRLTQADVRTASFVGVQIPAGVRIFGPGATPSMDMEPEYITVARDSNTAWVTLQENNAVAELDVDTAKITSVWPLGFKDHRLDGNALDPTDRDGVGNNGRKEIVNRPVLGMYLPDGVASYASRGETYLVTANEGDARADWPGFNEEARVSDLTLEAGVVDPPQLVTDDLTAFGRLTVTRANGNTDADPAYEELYAFGARSFSIWSASEHRQVYDSGDDLEQITAAQMATLFNSESGAGFDSRSDNKGPEPEGVTLGDIRGTTYAFVGLERIGGVIVFDVDDPFAPELVQYVNPEPTVDRAPEGLHFIEGHDSPTGEPLLVVANEVSGTTSIYEVTG
jgi:hypothetical protein